MISNGDIEQWLLSEQQAESPNSVGMYLVCLKFIVFVTNLTEQESIVPSWHVTYVDQLDKFLECQ